MVLSFFDVTLKVEERSALTDARFGLAFAATRRRSSSCWRSASIFWLNWSRAVSAVTFGSGLDLEEEEEAVETVEAEDDRLFRRENFALWPGQRFRRVARTGRMGETSAKSPQLLLLLLPLLEVDAAEVEGDDDFWKVWRPRPLLRVAAGSIFFFVAEVTFVDLSVRRASWSNSPYNSVT